mgnify:CR=1 FL=1
MSRSHAILLVVPVFFIAAFFYDNLPLDLSQIRLCSFWQLFRFDCPGCGLSRAIISLFQGNLLISIYHHPLGVILTLALTWLFTRELIQVLSGKILPKLIGRQAKCILGVFFMFILIGQWVFRLLLAKGMI